MERRLFGRLLTITLTTTFLSTAAVAQPPELPPVPEGTPALDDDSFATEDDAAPSDEPELVAPPLPEPNDSDVPVLPETEVRGTTTAGNVEPAPPVGQVDFPRQPLPDNVSITPNRIDTPTRQVGSTVAVLNRERIRQLGQPTVLETLRSANIPGLSFGANGGPGQTAFVFIRGAESRHTKVLLDGIPLDDPSNPSRSVDFANITSDNIERIEVLKGPQSTLYGSDAIGGVINIITRRGRGAPTFTLNSYGGKFDTVRTQVGSSGGNDVGYYSITGSFLDTNGFSAASRLRGNTEADGYYNGTLAGRGGIILNENIDFDAVFRYSDADTEFDGFGPVDAPFNHAKNETFYGRTQMRVLLADGAIETIVGYNYVDYNRDLFSFFGTTPAPFNARGENYRLDWRTNWTLLETDGLGLVVTTGADYLEEDYTTNFQDLVDQDNSAFYTQAILSLGESLTLTAGGRWDEFSSVGSANTYRVTGRYNVLETGTGFHGSIGTGFRAPSLDELFGFVGNPALLPEESFGWEYGFDQALFGGDVVIGATYFKQQFDNLVVFNPLVPPFGQVQNIAQADSQGVELTASLRLTDTTTLTASCTYLKTQDLTTGLQLPRRAGDQVGVAVNQSFAEGRGNVLFSLNVVGDRIDVGNTLLENYTLANLTGSYQLTDAVRLFGRVDNLFDQDYEEIAGFSTSPFAMYGGVSILLGPGGEE